MKKNVRILAAVVVVAAVAVGGYFLAGGSGLLGCIGRGCSRAPSKAVDFAVSGYSISPSKSGDAYKYLTVNFANKAPSNVVADLSVEISGNVSAKFGNKVTGTTSFIANDILVESEFCKNVISTPTVFVSIDKDNKVIETNENNNTYGLSQGDLTGLCLKYNTTKATFARALVAILGVSKGAGFTDTNYKGCFPDVIGQPYEQAVCYLKDKGYVKGYADGTFGPDNLMTRAEAVKLMEVVYESIKGKPGLDPTGQAAYNDVTGAAWYVSWIQSAAIVGITDVAPFKGLDFKPTDSLKNSDGLEMLIKLGNLVK